MLAGTHLALQQRRLAHKWQAEVGALVADGIDLAISFRNEDALPTQLCWWCDIILWFCKKQARTSTTLRPSFSASSFLVHAFCQAEARVVKLLCDLHGRVVRVEPKALAGAVTANMVEIANSQHGAIDG